MITNKKIYELHTSVDSEPSELYEAYRDVPLDSRDETALGGGAWFWERVKNRRGAEAVSLGLTLVLLGLCVLSLAAGTFQPFIYQQF